MALKAKLSEAEFSALESDELKEFYTKKDDGTYVLEIEGQIPGMVSKQKLEEFRDGNVRLREQIEELEEKYKDLDPDKAKQALDELQKLKDNKMIDEGKIDELVHQRTERMRSDHEAQVAKLNENIENLTAERSKFKQMLDRTLIDSQVVTEANKVGRLREGAADDLVNRARGTWTVDEDGNPVARDSQGTTVYDKEGKEPITISEWVSGLVSQAPHLFESSGGGGAGGGDDKGGGNSTNKIQAGDNDAFIANLDGIADGKVTVSGGGNA